MNSLDHGTTVSMQYKALLADPDTRTTCTTCPDIFLAILGAGDILIVFFDRFTGRNLTVEIFCKQ